MAENEISDFNEVNNSNIDMAGYPLGENLTRPPMVNDIVRALQGALKRWFKTSLFRLRDSTDQTKLLAFDLSALTTATTRTITFPDASGVVALTAGVAVATDPKRNRMVNGDKLVSQETGQTSGTTNGRYLSDQNAMYFVSSAGVFTGVNVQTISPAGGYRDRITITTADASLAAGEYLTYTQNIEGSNVRDFKWGAAGANQIVIRFGIKAPAGTYAMALHNNGATRSYVALFTITAPQANTDTVQTFAVPGDTTGTWLTADGVIGVTMDIVLACGSTFQGTTGWQAGNILGTSGVSNGIGTAAAVFEFFDAGMRLDPNSTGVYGSYEVGYTDAVYRSGRYYLDQFVYGIGVRSLGEVNGYLVTPFQISLMAKTPTLVAIPDGTANGEGSLSSGFPSGTISFTEITRTGGFLSGATSFSTTLNAPWRVKAHIAANARLS